MQKGQLVAIYVRVSTDKQVDGFSLEGQEAVISKDIGLHDKTVYKVYRDAGISGARQDRKGLEDLLRDARKGRFGEVVVWNVSRISRKLSHLLHIVEELHSLGIAFRSISESIDISTSIGQFSLQMLGAVAQMQRESWMESAKIGSRRKAKIGKCNGGSMLGYKLILDEEDDKGGTKLVILPEEAKTVNRIFKMYAEGYGLKAIVNKLNAENINGKNGASFSLTTVRGILTNTFYIGKIKYEDQSYQGLQEPIVSGELWTKVQNRLETKSKPVTKKVEHTFLLSGILKCPVCGAGMIPTHSSWENKAGIKMYYYYYTCGAYLNKGSSVCKGNNVRAIDAEEKVMLFLSNILGEVFWQRKVIKALKQKNQCTNTPIIEKRKQIEKNLAEIAKKQSENLKLYENDMLDKETFLTNMKQLKGLKETFQTQASECQYEDDNTCKYSDSDVEEALQKMNLVLQQADSDRKKELIHSLIKAIYVDYSRQPSEIELRFEFPNCKDEKIIMKLAI